jgi:hypothetical protein
MMFNVHLTTLGNNVALFCAILTKIVKIQTEADITNLFQLAAVFVVIGHYNKLAIATNIHCFTIY